LQRATLFLSPIAVVEMELLREIGRIRAPVAEVLSFLGEEHGVEEAPGDLREIAAYARLLGWTRDPFDRFIVAHAQACRALLLTADETIQAGFPDARWE
jgi:PIN domain nuclease of toxin-antitoxin system